MQQGSRERNLFFRYLLGICDESEKAELYKWIEQSADRKQLIEQFADLAKMVEGYKTLKEQGKDEEAVNFWNEKNQEFTEKYKYNKEG